MATKARTTVAFQGELGAFSHAAARKFLGEHIRMIPCTRFDDVFQTLREDEATHAVIPIENTLHGSVHENYDHLLEYDIPIVGETSIRISHQLIAMPGTRFRDVRRAFSHPVAINQCLRFFSAHKSIEQAPFYDTAGSVKMLREERPAGAAAIASATAAEIYGGVILRRNIEDDRRNFTRFFLLTKQKEKSQLGPRAWKTSLVLSTPNRSGSLFKVMASFALRDLNLTKIESRPLRGKPWEYLFYIDLEGHQDEEAVRNALRQLGEITSLTKVLGSYQTLP
ncbi:MAG TPA: prephenate dehydratase [Bryobacteraceae bacterium]|jgi:prephenate dehydratase|nr:prephenate dehydratase [Bryobacteraceae bacterium]